MTIHLKQSTASQEVPLGYFLDSTDGNTEETALTIANTDIKLWKAGATTLANKNSGGATHISNGIYYAVLDATDTNTLGPLVIFVHVAGALAVRLECCVLAANVYDSLIGGGDLLQVDTTQVGGTAQTAGDIIGDTNDIQARLPAALVGGRMDASVGAMAANTLTASALATDAVIEIVNGVWDEPLAGHATAGSTGAALSAAGSAGDPWSTPLPGAYGAGTAGNIIGNNLNATVSSRLASASYTAPLDAAGTRSAVGLASANLDTQLSGIQSDTNDIQTRIPATLVAGRMDASVGAMATDVVTATALATSAVTEIQSGLASQASVDTLAGYVDTEVAAIKAQTDKLTFNASNAVKANITHVIDDAVQQNGSTTTNWGGTP